MKNCGYDEDQKQGIGVDFTYVGRAMFSEEKLPKSINRDGEDLTQVFMKDRCGLNRKAGGSVTTRTEAERIVHFFRI